MSKGGGQAAVEAPRWVFKRASCNSDAILAGELRELVERDTADMNKLLDCQKEVYRYTVVKNGHALKVRQMTEEEPVPGREAVFCSTDQFQLRFSMSGDEPDVIVKPRWNAENLSCELYKPDAVSSPAIGLDLFVRENLEKFFFRAARIP